MSGGGSLSAWGEGFISGKMEKHGYSWDHFYGTSGGALAVTMASTHNPALMREAFTSFGNKQIWKDNPFNKRGKIKKINGGVRFIRSKSSLGSTANLRKTLEKIYTKELFDIVVSQGVSVSSCVSDYTTGDVAFGRNEHLDYETFLDYVWASTCVPVVCSPVKINNHFCLDGGVLMNIPIQAAIDDGCDEIDVIILKPDPSIVVEKDEWECDTMIDVSMRSIEMMMDKITDYSILVPKLKAKEKNIKLRIRYMPEKLAKNTADILNFDKSKLADWFDKGYAYADVEETSTKVKIKV